MTHTKNEAHDVAVAVAKVLSSTVGVMRELVFDERALASLIPEVATRNRIAQHFRNIAHTGDFNKVCILMLYEMCFSILVANDERTLSGKNYSFCFSKITTSGIEEVRDVIHDYLGGALMDLGIDPPMAGDDT